MKMKKGTRIYYGGDMANNQGTGTIIKVHSEKGCAEWVEIKMDDGRTMNIHTHMFSDEFGGTGLTNFVTLEAYNSYRKKAFLKLGFSNYREVTEIK